MYRLAICIPTYNRAEYLEKLLIALTAQLTDEVEIVVSDNASTDNTSEVVARYPVTYIRNKENLGPDRNALVAIEKSRAQYCWILGDDDLITEGAIDVLLQELDGKVAGVSFGVRGFDRDMQSPVVIFSDLRVKERTKLVGVNAVLSGIGTSMSYLGGQVFRKDLWDAALSLDDIESYFGGYFHVYVIYQIIRREPKWLFIPDVLVHWRSFNETRADERAIDANQVRLIIDAFSFEKILHDIFGSKSQIYRNGLYPYLNVHVPARIRLLKMLRAPLSLHLNNLVRIGRVYWNRFPFWAKIIPTTLTPWWFLQFLRVGVKQVRRVCKNSG